MNRPLNNPKFQWIFGKIRSGTSSVTTGLRKTMQGQTNAKNKLRGQAREWKRSCYRRKRKNTEAFAGMSGTLI